MEELDDINFGALAATLRTTTKIHASRIPAEIEERKDDIYLGALAATLRTTTGYGTKVYYPGSWLK